MFVTTFRTITSIECLFSALRIARLSLPDQSSSHEHKSTRGPGGHRIDLSRNMWPGSGLKVDSANTDVAWLQGREDVLELLCSIFTHRRKAFSNKIVTSSLNGEVVVWDINKSGHNKTGIFQSTISSESN
jgi:WD repeat-containing protein 24